MVAYLVCVTDVIKGKYEIYVISKSSYVTLLSLYGKLGGMPKPQKLFTSHHIE
jgi:hypothetical protein